MGVMAIKFKSMLISWNEDEKFSTFLLLLKQSNLIIVVMDAINECTSLCSYGKVIKSNLI